VTVRVTAAAPVPAPNGEEESESAESPETAQARATAPRRFTTPPGGALYRIAPGGDSRKLWQATNEVPFGLALRGDGKLLVSTGDRGRVHEIDEAGRSSILVRIPSDQASALSLDERGGILVGGTTDARVERIAAALPRSGSWLSPVHDAGAVADWGRLRWEADLPAGSAVSAVMRAGNSAEPDSTWTDWAALEGGRATLPPTRWVQVRLDLENSRGGASPQVRLLELFYRPHNRRPVIERATVEDPGVVWMQATTPSSRPVGPLVVADPVARKTVAGLQPAKVARPVRKLYEVGARTVSWAASDPDGDRLTYRIDVRREGTSSWIPLAEDLEETFFGWDARGIPDGLYRVRLSASDARDNVDGKDLEATRTTAPFRIDNTRPTLLSPQIRRRGERIEVEFVATDPGGTIVVTEIALGAGDWQPLEPLDGVTDEPEEGYRLIVDPPAAGLDDAPRALRVRVTDAAGNVGGDAWPLADLAP
jgi:hypothetical protein